MSSFSTYLIGFIVLIIGLAVAAYLVGGIVNSPELQLPADPSKVSAAAKKAVVAKAAEQAVCAAQPVERVIAAQPVDQVTGVRGGAARRG